MSKLDELLAAYARAYETEAHMEQDGDGTTLVIRVKLNESKLPEKFRNLRYMPVAGAKPPEGLRGLGYPV